MLRRPVELEQYTAIAYGQRCVEFDVRPSMGSVGDAYDNALCESFFATLECELLDRERFRTPAAARAAIFDYIEGWYNSRRRHSALGYESPLHYERIHAVGSFPTASPATSSAALAPGATIRQGGAISLSPGAASPPRWPCVNAHEYRPDVSSSPSTKAGQVQCAVPAAPAGLRGAGLGA